MKRTVIAIVAALCLVLAVCPVFAFTGVTEDPGLPAINTIEEAPFTVNVTRVENEPEITENEYGEEVYTWIPMDAEAEIAAGDTISFMCELVVPTELGGYTEEQLEAIEVMFGSDEVEGLTLVHATGCDANYECDFEAGYCYPLPGYGNADIEGNALVIDAHLATNPRVVISGTATGANPVIDVQCTIGQYCVPTIFSVGDFEKVETGNTVVYDVHFKDTFNVQMIGMKFTAVDGMMDTFTVCHNNHEYARGLNADNVAAYFEVIDGELSSTPITEGELYDRLEATYALYMDFFGFVDDGVQDVMTDGVFLRNCGEAGRYTTEFGFGTQTPEPTAEPIPEPTPEPTPQPPETGAISLAVIGAAAVIGSIGVIVLRKKDS